MPINIPRDLPAKTTLENENIIIMTSSTIQNLYFLTLILYTLTEVSLTLLNLKSASKSKLYCTTMNIKFFYFINALSLKKYWINFY